MTQDPHSWAQTLDGLFNQAWVRLIRGVHDRHTATRHPTLASVDKHGQPQARTVVLRAADKNAATLQIHTDLHSAKVAELRTNPAAALHVWDASAHLQIRIAAQVSILTGDAVSAIWDKVPTPSRSSYGSMPAPGQPVADALAYRKGPDPAAFAVIQLDLQAMDLLHLGPNHRRARFLRSDDWRGEWLVP